MSTSFRFIRFRPFKMIHSGINLRPVLRLGYVRLLKSIVPASNVTGPKHMMYPTRQDCLLYQPYSNTSLMANPTAAVVVQPLWEQYVTVPDTTERPPHGTLSYSTNQSFINEAVGGFNRGHLTLRL